MAMYVDSFIADQRHRLDQLERFAQSTDYRRLLAVAKDASADADTWLAEWLIRPAFGLGAVPIDVAAEPGGVDRLVGHIAQVMRNTGG